MRNTLFFLKTCCNNMSYNSALRYDSNLLLDLEHFCQHSFELVFARFLEICFFGTITVFKMKFHQTGCID